MNRSDALLLLWTLLGVPTVTVVLIVVREVVLDARDTRRLRRARRDAWTASDRDDAAVRARSLPGQR